MQEVWSEGIGREEELSDKICNECKQIVVNYLSLKSNNIPRWVGLQPRGQVEIHEFWDTSEKSIWSLCNSLAVGEIKSCSFKNCFVAHIRAMCRGLYGSICVLMRRTLNFIVGRYKSHQTYETPFLLIGCQK